MAEKSVSEIPRDLRLLYQKGNDALARENTDYAIDLFNQVLEKEPTFFECRKALRTAQAKKAEGSSSGFFKRVMSSAGSSPGVAKAQLALRRNPVEALPIAEQVLNTDPTNSGAHRVIVEAATAMQMHKTLTLSLEVLIRNSPKDKDLVIKTAEALGEQGEVARAEKILADAMRAFPNDADIFQAQKNLSAHKTMNQGGYESLAGGKGSFRDALRNKDEAVSLEQEKRVQKSEDVSERLISEYETRLQTEPQNLKLLRSLAELYTQKKQFDQAIGIYDRIKASEMGGADATLDRAMADTKVKRFEHQLTQLDPTAPEYTQAMAALSADKAAFQIAECQKRVEKYPTDLAIRFEMGVLYFQAGKTSEAIQEFQKAQNSQHKRIAAMSYLAQCFGRRKMFDLAAKKLQEAIKEKAGFDEEKKELIYNLGCMLEGMGKKDEALEQFKQIYEVDIGYRDVAAKVDAYYAGQ